MKKENKEMLRMIISNQELIMKALKIEIQSKTIEKKIPTKVEIKKATKKKATK